MYMYIDVCIAKLILLYTPFCNSCTLIVNISITITYMLPAPINFLQVMLSVILYVVIDLLLF